MQSQQLQLSKFLLFPLVPLKGEGSQGDLISLKIRLPMRQVVE